MRRGGVGRRGGAGQAPSASVSPRAAAMLLADAWGRLDRRRWGLPRAPAESY
jgi:hypothetical protein